MFDVQCPFFQLVKTWMPCMRLYPMTRKSIVCGSMANVRTRTLVGPPSSPSSPSANPSPLARLRSGPTRSESGTHLSSGRAPRGVHNIHWWLPNMKGSEFPIQKEGRSRRAESPERGPLSRRKTDRLHDPRLLSSDWCSRYSIGLC